MQEEPLVVTIVVPDDATPGTKLECTAPDGQELCLTVPPNVPPGSVMTLTQDLVSRQWRCVAEPADGPPSAYSPPAWEGEQLSHGSVPGMGLQPDCMASASNMRYAENHVAPKLEEPVSFTIAVPQGMQPGMKLHHTAPDGQDLRLSIPDNVAPGSLLTLTQDPVNKTWSCTAEPADLSMSYAHSTRQMMDPHAVTRFHPTGQAPTVTTITRVDPMQQPMGPMPVALSYVPPPAVTIEGHPSYQPPPMAMMTQQQRPSYQPPPVPLVQRHSYTPPPVSIAQQRPSYTPPPGVVATNHLVMPNMVQGGCPITTAPLPMAPQQHHSYVPPPAAGVVQSSSYVPPVQPLPGFAPPPGGGSLHMPAAQGPSITTLPTGQLTAAHQQHHMQQQLQHQQQQLQQQQMQLQQQQQFGAGPPPSSMMGATMQGANMPQAGINCPWLGLDLPPIGFDLPPLAAPRIGLQVPGPGSAAPAPGHLPPGTGSGPCGPCGPCMPPGSGPGPLDFRGASTNMQFPGQMFGGGAGSLQMPPAMYGQHPTHPHPASGMQTAYG